MALYVGGMGARGKNFYNDIAQRYGYEKEADDVQDLYLDGKKADAAAARAGARWSRRRTSSARRATSPSASPPTRRPG